MTSEHETWTQLKAEYLRKVEKALSSVRSSRRKDVLEDVRAHLDRRFTELPAGRQTWENFQAIITEMGPPSDYAELLAPDAVAASRNVQRHYLLWIGVAVVVIAAAIVLAISVLSKARPVTLKEFRRDFREKVAQLDIDTATLDDVILIFGEPMEYVWGTQIIDRDNIPVERYCIKYPDDVSLFMRWDAVVELRFESPAADYAFRGKIRVGSSLDEVLQAVGRPTETITGEPIEWADGVLYKDANGRKGHCYYARADQDVRFFFNNYKVTALYVTGNSSTRAIDSKPAQHIKDKVAQPQATTTRPDDVPRGDPQVGAPLEKVVEAASQPTETVAVKPTESKNDVVHTDINAKIAQLNIDTASLDDVIRIFGEPAKYSWRRKTLTKTNLPSTYIVYYPNGFKVVISDGRINALRHEGPDGYVFRGKLQVGSSLEEVLQVVGQPSKTVIGKAIGWVDGVLYKDVNGRKGRCYYARADQNVRFFFGNYKVTALYVTRSNSGRRSGGSFMTVRTITSVKEYDDVRWKNLSKLDLAGRKGLIATLTFNQKTVWPEQAKMPPGNDPNKILTDAMNPGLGVRKLHQQGITGKGVNVAIIDQPLYLKHPEFVGKIVAYHDTGCETDNSSMHGPAVASLLVGTKCGTAPGCASLLRCCAILEKRYSL